MRIVIDISEYDKEWIGNAYGIPQDINTKIAEAIINAEPCQPEPHWIPVTEDTLPKKNRVVVVCGEKGTWDYGMYRGHTPSDIHLWEWKRRTLKRVYWWMYKEDALPEPYKGVTG